MIRMVSLTYIGPDALAVADVGEWKPDETKTVDADLAARLLVRPDFQRTPAKTPARAAKARAKTTDQ